MEKLNGNGSRINTGERFTILDCNPVVIPRVTSLEDPLVAMLRPRIMLAIVTKVQDMVEGDDLWQKFHLQVITGDKEFAVSTKRRIWEGIYTNRSYFYLYFQSGVDLKLLREFFNNLTNVKTPSNCGDLAGVMGEYLNNLPQLDDKNALIGSG